MPFRTPREAVNAFRDAINLAALCVGQCQASLGPEPYAIWASGKAPRWLAINRGEPVRLRHDRFPLSLRASLHYHVVVEAGSYKVRTAAYHCSLEDDQEREYLAYHWHPDGPSDARYPHLHIGPAAGVPPSPDGLINPRVHIPTGRIALEDLLRLTIEQLGATPTRPDWAKVLAQLQASFEQQRSWAQSSGPPAQ